MNKAQEIDKLVSRQYKSIKYTELNALSRLYSVEFIRKLEGILNHGCQYEPNFKDCYDVSLGWIDKIPLASFNNQVKDINGNLIKGKVELGDILIIYTHSQKFESKGAAQIKVFDKRAIIIQAKISKTKAPNVPITKIRKDKVTSTSKELALLSDWPSFDLFTSSRSKKEELQNIKLNRRIASSKFAGFYDKNWHCGEPDYLKVCNQSFGELIVGIINKVEGSAFQEGSKSDWDTLISKLLELCGEHYVPGYIFGKNKSKRIIADTLYVNPIGWLLDFFRKKRFPVIVINRIFFEGNQ